MKIIDTFKAVSSYPIPSDVIQSICVMQGLDMETEATSEVVEGRAYKLALSDLYQWLASAPNVSQGGQTYSFTEYDKKLFVDKSFSILTEAGNGDKKGSRYGYKGDSI